MSDAAADPLLHHALNSIAVGSKSFASASRLFDPATRRSAVLLYAWCRHCDDVIDGQEAGHNAVPLSPAEAQVRLAELRARTHTAYLGAPLEDPAFAALQAVVQRHGIAREEALDLLQGFAMDVEEQQYQTLADTLQYCYHVAGVVGLMMARIMGTQDPQVLDRACDLGLAMQLTNIARDIVDDAKVGRCYLPRQWLEEFGMTPATLGEPRHRAAVALLAQRLIDAAEPYYASAEAGLAALPWRSAWAVA
ncbi:phytoene/squalene synthase family protein, partial [Pseudomonas sp.]|uniref:phytoene/squalene synthase family protein n=1 Tax=Pseudomonas sp. TaxID=306 RepID=UPI0028A981B5